MLKPETIDWLFARLAIRYMDQWTRKLEGLPIEAVRHDWATHLGRLQPHHLRYGIDLLPPSFPPTVGEFLALCLAAPAPPGPPLLDAPKPDPLRLRAELERLHRALKDRRPTDWIADLEATPLDATRRAMVAQAKANLGPGGQAITITEADQARTAELIAASNERVAAYSARTGHAC